MIVLALSGLFHFTNKCAHWAVWPLLKMSPLRYDGLCLWLSELNEGYPYGAPCGSEGASDQIMQWAGSWFNSLWLVFNSCRSQETSWMCTAVRAWQPPPSPSAAPALQTCKTSRESWPVCISVCGLPSLYFTASSSSFLWHRSFTGQSSQSDCISRVTHHICHFPISQQFPVQICNSHLCIWFIIVSVDIYAFAELVTKWLV